MKSILDPGFQYVSSDKTDLRKTFRRIRREMATPAPKTATVRESIGATLRLASSNKSAA
jgi:signal recognition particle subunit SEC65